MSSIFLESETFGFGNDSFADLEGLYNSSQTEKNYMSSEGEQEKIHKKTEQNIVKNFSPKKISQKSHAPLEVISRSESLKSLLLSMKPSFLKRDENPESIRQIFLCNDTENAMFLLRKWDQSVLVGTGFFCLSEAGNNFPAFTDIRLPFSERERLQGWILLDENLDTERLFLILEALDFPCIFSTPQIIAKIRDNASENILQKIRFCEIFSQKLPVQNIGSFEFSAIKSDNKNILALSAADSIFGYEMCILPENIPTFAKDFTKISLDGNIFHGKNFQKNFAVGEVLSLSEGNIFIDAMKFSFDTFFVDGNSVGALSGFTVSDRKNLSEGGVLVFTMEENTQFKTISGHIFIDSRGFVHSHEMLKIHKEIIKVIRAIYEEAVLENPNLERSALIRILRSEVAKYCLMLTGRMPMVMPIIIDKKHF